MTKKHDEWWETLTDEEAEEENQEYSESIAAMKEVYLKKGREAGLRKAIELIEEREPFKRIPDTTKLDRHEFGGYMAMAGRVELIIRLTKALEAELEKEK